MLNVVDRASRYLAGIVVKYTKLSNANYGFERSWICQFRPPDEIITAYFAFQRKISCLLLSNKILAGALFSVEDIKNSY